MSGKPIYMLITLNITNWGTTARIHFWYSDKSKLSSGPITDMNFLGGRIEEYAQAYNLSPMTLESITAEVDPTGLVAELMGRGSGWLYARKQDG